MFAKMDEKMKARNKEMKEEMGARMEKMDVRNKGMNAKMEMMDAKIDKQKDIITREIPNGHRSKQQ